MDIILFEPEIPPNTGNVARLCAGLGLGLHLIEPLGFSLDDRYLKRAGLDYWPYVKMRLWQDWEKFKADWAGGRIIATSATTGKPFTEYAPLDSDALLFGPETRGLPDWLISESSEAYNIPMNPGVRSINLATSVGFFMGLALSRLQTSHNSPSPGSGAPPSV
ncbi:MAG: tRNA (cytidine(34)-2'-O)-methyltransferase [Deltaproteobacteria bacterium]|jgi:tRNA (cytidine/uridine-2'-O-)-methyltransferase|nr:tRNA (cytidine(34)-2'-O)-methyltransferase [Deltaproteobacteria bacterium]